MAHHLVVAVPHSFQNGEAGRLAEPEPALDLYPHMTEPLLQVHIEKGLGYAVGIAHPCYTEHATSVISGCSSQRGQNRFSASLELCPALRGPYCGQCLLSQLGGGSRLPLPGA
jgi:hypothetical protein